MIFNGNITLHIKDDRCIKLVMGIFYPIYHE